MEELSGSIQGHELCGSRRILPSTPSNTHTHRIPQQDIINCSQLKNWQTFIAARCMCVCLRMSVRLVRVCYACVYVCICMRALPIFTLMATFCPRHRPRYTSPKLPDPTSWSSCQIVELSKTTTTNKQNNTAPQHKYKTTHKTMSSTTTISRRCCCC